MQRRGGFPRLFVFGQQWNFVCRRLRDLNMSWHWSRGSAALHPCL